MDGIRERVNAGELSPLYYYQEKNFLDPRTFAKFLGVSYWRYRREVKPKGFAKLNRELLQKYALALDISVDELLTMK
jgi:beta-mannanase